ncbi:MAG TPA: ABC transporter ATP-binding protein [Thermoanaerobaculia bacterium]|nr:ABC transporter ATP-binding protein [Thermoanaerobaculia bacterium]
MSEPAVHVEQLTKVYRVYASPWDRLREALLRRPRHREFRALSGVSFSLPKGEGLAIIGENGAGKSTLLKLLAGIGVPTAGAVRVQGKVASILELGSGFHPEFTGRQNIVLNAAMLGLSELELQQKLPSIVSWSELGDFIDQPVKVYSTGMAMRLGFSIAIQVEPDVLIIDEALSVGDGYFQKKCMDRLLQFVGSGGTLLFCSHAMYYVSAFCQRALWLRHGRAEALGPVGDVVRDYENFLLAKSAPSARQDDRAPGAREDDRAPSADGDDRAPGTGEGASDAELPTGVPAGGRAGAPGGGAGGDLAVRPARLLGVRVSGGASAEAPTGAVPLFAPGDTLEIEIEFESQDAGRAFHVGIGVNRIDDLEVCSLATHLDGRPPMTGRTRYRISAVLPRLTLVKGEFTLYVFLLDEAGLHIYDQRIYRRAFGVHSRGYAFGVVSHDHRWQEAGDAALAAAAPPAATASLPAPAIAGRR